MDPKKLLIICLAFLALSALFSFEYHLLNGVGDFTFNFGGNWRSKTFLALLIIGVFLYARSKKTAG